MPDLTPREAHERLVAAERLRDKERREAELRGMALSLKEKHDRRERLITAATQDVKSTKTRRVTAAIDPLTYLQLLQVSGKQTVSEWINDAIKTEIKRQTEGKR